MPNQRVVLKANYGYWGGEEPWDKVTFKILTNSAARVAALLSGDVQMIETVPTSDIAKLSADKNFALADKVSNRVIYVHLNQWNDKTAPFVTAKDGKPSTRTRSRTRACARRCRWRSTATRSSTASWRRRRFPPAQLLPDFFPGTSKKLKPAEVRSRRREEAAGRGGLSQRLRDHHPRHQQPLHQRRQDRAGDRAVLLARRHRREGRDDARRACTSRAPPRASSATCCSGWGTESGEQGSSLRSLLATHDLAKGMGVTNRGRYSNPAFDKELADALVTMDDKKREAMIQQAAETAMNDTALIPIHYEVSTWATAKGYKYTARTDQYTLATDLKPSGR